MNPCGFYLCKSICCSPEGTVDRLGRSLTTLVVTALNIAPSRWPHYMGDLQWPEANVVGALLGISVPDRCGSVCDLPGRNRILTARHLTRTTWYDMASWARTGESWVCCWEFSLVGWKLKDEVSRVSRDLSRYVRYARDLFVLVFVSSEKPSQLKARLSCQVV